MKQLQDTFQTLASNSCLGLCYIKWLKPYAKDTVILKNFIDGIETECIDEEGYVLNAERLLGTLDDKCRIFNVQKVNITSFEEIGEIPMPVMFSMDGGKSGHFVLANNEGIVWNSLDNSINVKYGKLCSMRKITTK